MMSALAQTRFPATVHQALAPLGTLLSRTHEPVIVTGLEAGAGTSTIAIALSKSLAITSGKRILLVDADCRTVGHPALTPLRSDADTTQPLATDIENLFVLPPSTTQCANPLQCYKSTEFHALIMAHNSNFDHVIIDTPPLLIFADTLALSQYGWPTIFVADARSSRIDVAITAREQVENNAGKVLGVILNRRKYYLPQFLYERL